MKSITHTHISTSICIQEELIVRKEEESESYNQFRGGLIILNWFWLGSVIHLSFGVCCVGVEYEYI